MSTRKDLEKKQAKLLSEIKILEKKLNVRKPKVEQANRKLATLKADALKRVEAFHTKNTQRLTKEVKTFTDELALKRKGYVEVSTEILTPQVESIERITVPPRTLLSVGSLD